LCAELRFLDRVALYGLNVRGGEQGAWIFFGLLRQFSTSFLWRALSLRVLASRPGIGLSSKHCSGERKEAQQQTKRDLLHWIFHVRDFNRDETEKTRAKA
jgi:hypothetical protein